MSIKPIAPLPRDPRTPREWQEAADAAWAMLVLDSCRQYGLVEGGPEINFDRCVAILERAKAKGIEPREEF